MDRPLKKRANLYIINLQWTPKDVFANQKINGKCDVVMQKVMDMLGLRVPKYQKCLDPIYTHSTALHLLECHTTTQPLLKIEEDEKPQYIPKVEKQEIICCESSLKLEEEIKPPLVQNHLVNKDCNNRSNNDLTNKMFSDNCDASDKKCLPVVKKSNSLSHSFSIENLLKNDPKPLIETKKPNYYVNPALSMFSYNLLGVYTDFFLYPYQTSFLYSGLHSIINPMPIYESDVITHPEKELVKTEPECSYCDVTLGSTFCLFYSKFEPIFCEKKFRFSKIEQKEKLNICVCCDYTTDEDELDSSNVSDSNSRDQNKGKIQAGWFGKGYKKGRRRRKGI